MKICLEKYYDLQKTYQIKKNHSIHTNFKAISTSDLDAYINGLVLKYHANLSVPKAILDTHLHGGYLTPDEWWEDQWYGYNSDWVGDNLPISKKFEISFPVM